VKQIIAKVHPRRTCRQQRTHPSTNVGAPKNVHRGEFQTGQPAIRSQRNYAFPQPGRGVDDMSQTFFLRSGDIADIIRDDCALSARRIAKNA